MLQSKTRWIVRQADEQMVDYLARHLDISPLAATLLVNRGINNLDDAKQFLNIEENNFLDPFLMHNMDLAVKRIYEAIESNESILIFGDYDADGVTSTAILMTVLKELGASPQFYIPNRFKEGYGPNEAAFRQAALNGVKLIITVDTGIAAVHEAEIASSLGIDLIITDHHEPGPVLPAAYAILHPKYPGKHYPFPDLAGVGVTLKLAHALYGKVPVHLLDLAAIGTIADLVPLQGENRLIVKKGLDVLAASDRPGLLALCKVAGTNLSQANEDTVGFGLAPRLNAAGRLDSADPAVQLLLTTDQGEAEELAQMIDELNKERQQLVSKITEEALKMIETEFPPEDHHVFVIGNQGWNPGVIGIVASRITERYYRPTIILSYDDETGMAKGSGRSISGFDLFANLQACSDILPHFGGHPMAAGMTLAMKDVGTLRKKLNKAAASQLSEEDFIPITELDASVSLENIDIAAIQQIDKLAPYGIKNPKPAFLIETAKVPEVRKIGADRNHLKLLLEQSGKQLDGVGFHLGSKADEISPEARLSVIGELAVNEWNNVRKPQIFVKDLAINEWQLFDFRGNKQTDQWVSELPGKNVTFFIFNEMTQDQFPFLQTRHTKRIKDLEQAKATEIDGEYIVLFDLPKSTEELDHLVHGKAPARIYVHFFQEEGHFFTTLPTREHFKWYYAFLAKRKFFDVRNLGEDLAAYRGWTKDTVEFMTKVFLELDFVTIKDGEIALTPVKKKKDLADSFTYQNRQRRIELENSLIYSSYKELKSWFDQRITHSPLHEEEVEVWT